MTGVQFLAGAGVLSLLHHHIQTSSGAHQDSYPISTKRSFLKGKAVGTWKLPLISM